MEAVIQTRKVGKERNKDASILIDRHFSPATRAYGYRELHPEWSNIAHWQQEAEKFDSLYIDSIRRVDGLYLWTKLKSKVSGAVKVRIWRLKLMSKVLMPTMIYARLSISFAIMAKLSPLSRK